MLLVRISTVQPPWKLDGSPLHWSQTQIPLLGIYPREMKTCPHTQNIGLYSYSALFTIAKIGETQISSDRWVDKHIVAHANNKNEWNIKADANTGGPQSSYL